MTVQELVALCAKAGVTGTEFVLVWSNNRSIDRRAQGPLFRRQRWINVAGIRLLSARSLGSGDCVVYSPQVGFLPVRRRDGPVPSRRASQNWQAYIPCLRHQSAPSAARPAPNTASDAGSGTRVAL
jgi:hypothetical protein